MSTASRIQSLLKQRRELASVAPVAAPVAAMALNAAAPVEAQALKLPTLKAPSGGFFASIISILFYISATAFILFLLLTFVHFTIRPIFAFTPTDKAFFRMSPSEGRENGWTSVPARFNVPAEVLKPKSCDYTLSLDVFKTQQYLTSSAPRVLLYRSDAPVSLPATAKVTDLLTLFLRTNIIAYIDSTKNDLFVGAVTAVNGQKRIEYAKSIANVPEAKAFRISIVLMPTFFEVYLNGQLQSSTPLKGQLVESSDVFYGPPEIVNPSLVRVGQLAYWPRPIPSSDIREAGPILSNDFFTKTT